MRRRSPPLLPLLLLLPLLPAGCGDSELATAALPAALAHDEVPQTISGGVVISQVYGGGGNTGAPYTHDYIELFNRGSATLSLDGWSVQYASATGTGSFGGSSTQLTALSGTLAPGQYLLVQEAGGTTGAPLPAPDITDASPIAMSATAGKVALVNSTTPLGCNGGSTPCSPAQLAQIVDLVGYGGANFYEGAAPAPALSNTTAALRANDGCTETDNNATDFTAGAPAPRNTASPLNVCSTEETAPAVASTSPADGTTGVPLGANIGVTFSEAVNVSGEWFTILCTGSGTHTATVGGGPTGFTLNPASDFAQGETCTVTIIALQVTDQDTSDPPDHPAGDYSWDFITETCEDPFTPIPTIQGNGPSAALPGLQTTKGVVVGDYQGASPALRGFFIQDATGDGDPETSDGIFVFEPGAANTVSLGDVVRVSGTVKEYEDQTEISATSILSCGTGTVAPTDITLPFESLTARERYEGMLVRLPQTLYVTEHFQLGRFGQVVMSSTDRLPQPTAIVTPGPAAIAQHLANNLNRIIIDDALNNQNPDPIVFGRGGLPLSASNTLRGGDQATGITGVMTYTWGGQATSPNDWRVRPVYALDGYVNFEATNPRPGAPASVGGTLRVASFNPLSYFNTFSGCTAGVGGAATGCYGASNAAEFERQAAKTVATLTGLDAHVVGLVELENDGYGVLSAIADLVDRLNAATAPGTYAYIDADAATGQLNALGTDAIKVGLIYQPAVVTPIGATAVLNSDAFVNGGDAEPRNRPTLAQAFEHSDGARFIVSVNHFKSKGGACDAPDAGDGQGNCSMVRTNAANALLAWLATDPTHTGEQDVLIIGDLNSYAQENPITALTSGGFTNLLQALLGANAYTYVFDGEWGYLDQALASTTLNPYVTGVSSWHINADEPLVLDYNMEFKSAGQLTSLYSPEAYRSSDHDPVLVGLSLAPTVGEQFGGFEGPVDDPPTENTAKAGSVVAVEFSLGGYYGLDILASGYPTSAQIACPLSADTSLIEETATAGQSGLTYDAATGLYTYIWKTDKAWKNTCRQLVLRFTDGWHYDALFRFTK